jgi:hypothetical protein
VGLFLKGSIKMKRIKPAIKIAVLLLVGFATGCVATGIFLRSGIQTSLEVPLIVRNNISELTGEGFEKVVEWVTKNMELQEIRQMVNFLDGSAQNIEANDHYMAPFLNDMEDVEAQTTAYRWKYIIEFPELPDFMKKGLEAISEKDIGKSINDILPWLPQQPVYAKSVNTATGESYVRYLECFLDSISGDKRNIVIVTENFNFSDNPLFAGRLCGVNRVCVPYQWQDRGERAKITTSATFFERKHRNEEN